MKKIAFLFIGLLTVLFLACTPNDPTNTAETSNSTTTEEATNTENFVWSPEHFSDKKIVRYQIPGWDKLSLQQKKLVYFLSQAGYAGRDIIYDQNYRHNLVIRRALDKIVKEYKGDRTQKDWESFLVYTKEVWFANGIHHHYSMDKFTPDFSRDFFVSLLEATNTSLADEVLAAIFDPSIDAKKVSLDSKSDLVLSSAVNFYGPNVTTAAVEKYYASIIDKEDKKPVSYGLNSKLVLDKDGRLSEQVYSEKGLYGAAITEIIGWLSKAAEVAENEGQGHALRLLIEYYQTGDLKKWDEYNIAWTEATDGDIDYINSFIEVYNDPLGYTGSYENIVQIKDFDASARMSVVADNVQWFEDNSPLMEAHKKKKVKGVTYKVVSVAAESGDASPATPIGVNLPNANWIRVEHGSKSVSLGNIVSAYEQANGPGTLQEFAHDEEEVEMAKKYGSLGSDMHTALHEVVGHASGQIEDGVGTPKETLKNYASALEEGRADLVALYYIVDPKMQEIGLLENDGAAIAEYDGYIRNGLMAQLRRIELGKDIEESHMRNRQMVAAWAFENGKKENVISKVVRDGKTYFEINDYTKLRELFGQLLRECQRIKSQGDYAAVEELFETYGVKVDQELHKEVLERSATLNIPPYGGFINPRLVEVKNDAGEVIDIKVEYPDDFTKQMLEYGEMYNFLPDVN